MPFIESLNPYVLKTRAHEKITVSIDELEDFRGRDSIVDLGCGNGHFLRDYLAKHPHLTGLGVERRFKRAFKSAQKLPDGISRIVQGDVIEFLENNEQGFWNEIWMQFPDPWPKLKHEKNRMLGARTFLLIHRGLKPGGRFLFRSDCWYYWTLLQELNAKYKAFSIELAKRGDLFIEEPTTLYHQKFSTRNIPIYSLEFRKC